MSTISNSAFTFNQDGWLVGVNRFASGMADELSPAVAAEMDEAFNYRMPPNEAEIDRMYEAEMIRRDALASNARIELSVATATGGKYAAAVRKGLKVYKLGKFTLESSAWVACQHKAAELRREYLSLA